MRRPRAPDTDTVFVGVVLALIGYVLYRACGGPLPAENRELVALIIGTFLGVVAARAKKLEAQDEPPPAARSSAGASAPPASGAADPPTPR